MILTSASKFKFSFPRHQLKVQDTNHNFLLDRFWGNFTGKSSYSCMKIKLFPKNPLIPFDREQTKALYFSPFILYINHYNALIHVASYLIFNVTSSICAADYAPRRAPVNRRWTGDLRVEYQCQRKMCVRLRAARSSQDFKCRSFTFNWTQVNSQGTEKHCGCLFLTQLYPQMMTVHLAHCRGACSRTSRFIAVVKTV